jgi:saccharopine dehydrogenase (NADP+, L-glutamate forming)/spermidine synthase
MKKILILGAGLVSRPGVVYLLEHGFEVTVASRTLQKAEDIVAGFENGNAIQFEIQDEERLDALVRKNDIIVSLLPWTFHIIVARCCLHHGKHMATASYVSDEMRGLDADARAKGLLFLNEVGVDPGMDHMSAMQIIDRVHDQGGKVRHFYSFCGGLPAPEHNDNPFGYKFSWSPRGVVLASKNAARFFENGEEIKIPGEALFSHYRRGTIEGLGRFEVYPNRDAKPYRDLYGLKDADTVMRGTYRNVGWCDTFKAIVDLGLVDEAPDKALSNTTLRKMMADIAGVAQEGDVKAAIARQVGLPEDHFVIHNLEWLGLFEEERVASADNRLDILCEKLMERLRYRRGEKDMLLMRHTFGVENVDGSRTNITSTLIEYGIAHGDSAMARTVSLPLGIGIQLMAEGKIGLTGIQIPTKKELYEPILHGLSHLGIRMTEEVTPTAPSTA